MPGVLGDTSVLDHYLSEKDCRVLASNETGLLYKKGCTKLGVPGIINRENGPK